MGYSVVRLRLYLKRLPYSPGHYKWQAKLKQWKQVGFQSSHRAISNWDQEKIRKLEFRQDLRLSGKWGAVSIWIAGIGFVTKGNVRINKDEVKIININYKNPRVLVNKQDFSLSVKKGLHDNLPRSQIETDHLVKGGDLHGIDQDRLVQALKNDENNVAAITILNSQKPSVSLILSALNDKSLKLSVVTSSFTSPC